jgi:hypothetical protein
MLSGLSSDKPRRFVNHMEMLLTSGGRQVQGSADRTPRGSGRGLHRVLSFGWALLPVLSFGYLAPIPIIHAAVKLRTWTLWAAAALYTAAEIVMWSATMTVTSGPVEAAEVSEPPGWAAALLMGLVVVPTIHALTLRGRVFAPSTPTVDRYLAVQGVRAR